jgi:hypothetical protein
VEPNRSTMSSKAFSSKMECVRNPRKSPLDQLAISQDLCRRSGPDVA